MKFYSLEEIRAVGNCVQFATTVLGLEINHEGRCQATWRGGDGFNVSISEHEWFDHVAKVGGGIVELCAIAKFGDIELYQPAQEILGDWLNLTPAMERGEQPMVSARQSELLADGYVEKTRYNYVDLDGDLIHFVARFEHPEKPKEFMQGTPSGWGLRKTTPILYRMSDWINSPKVCIVEGEKDADTLIDQLGIPATTNCGGAQKWRPEYSLKFQQKHVCIICDNDNAGKTHATMIAQKLEGITKSIRVICPSEKEKGDITDWVTEEHGTKDQLLKLIKDSPEWKLELSDDQKNIVDRLIGQQSELWTGEIPDVVPDLVILPNGKGVFYRHELNEIHGEPGRGKSWIALAATKQVLDQGGKVIFLDPESSAAKIIRRLRILGCEASQSPRFIHLNPGNFLEWQAVKIFANLHYLPDLVVIDGIASYMQQDELNEDIAADCIKFLKDKCNPFKKQSGVLLTDHVTKSSDRGRWSRGSGAKLGEYKGVVYEMKTDQKLSPENGGTIILSVAKDNEGGAGSIGEVCTVLQFSPMVDNKTNVEFLLPDNALQTDAPNKMSKPDAKAHARHLLQDRAWKQSEWVQAVQRDSGRTATNFIKEFTDYSLDADGIVTEKANCGKSRPNLIGPRQQVSELKIQLEQAYKDSRQQSLPKILNAPTQ